MTDPTIQPLAMRVLPFIAAAAVLVPLPSQWRARNVATLSMILLLFLSNISYGVNAILWNHNVIVKAVTWCDIVVRFQVFVTVALPAASLCLTRRLYAISAVKQVSTTREDKRRRLMIDLFICYGIPLIPTAAYYIVQGHRYDLVENMGCRGSLYASWPAIIIIYLPPLSLSLTSCTFACLALRNFMKRRATFATHLRSSQSGLTTSRYLRLMSMSLVEMTWGLTILILNMVITLSGGLRPYDSWADVHSNFSRIDQYVLLFVPKQSLALLYLTWWAIPSSAFVFCAFFAFGQETLTGYRTMATWIRRNVFRQTVHDSTTSSFNKPPPYKPPVQTITFDLRASKPPVLPPLTKAHLAQSNPDETSSRFLPSWLPTYYGSDLDSDAATEVYSPQTPSSCYAGTPITATSSTAASYDFDVYTRPTTPSSYYIVPEVSPGTCWRSARALHHVDIITHDLTAARRRPYTPDGLIKPVLNE